MAVVRRKFGVGIVALVGLGTLLLSGCASAEPEASDGTVLATEAEFVAETQEAEQIEDAATEQTSEEDIPETSIAREPLEIPTCDAMNPILQAWHEEAVPKYPTMQPSGEVGLERFEMYAGPTAQSAMNSAVQYRGCYYPIHLELAGFEWIAELPAPEQTALIDALSSDPSINSYVFGDARAFEYSVVLEYGVQGEVQVAYVFVGDVWITVFNGFRAGELSIYDVEALLAPIVDANPTLEVSLGL